MQFDALYEIARAVHNSGLSTLCFSGKSFKTIKSNYSKIFPYIDILVDGEYIEEEKDFSRPWVGSKNQKFYFLSDRYDESILKQYKNKAEIRINQNGEYFINGMGDFEKLCKTLEITPNRRLNSKN